jgi:molybdopterin-guanine dinucleotide biosynthesis protein A
MGRPMRIPGKIAPRAFSLWRQEFGRPLTGVVLTGGRSSRLGQDKALLRLSAGNGPDLLTRTVSLLRKVCGQCVVIGRKLPGFACFPDIIPGNGPVGGIATALELTRSSCLVLSCDLPFMSEAVLEALAAEHAKRPSCILSTAYKRGDTGHIEPLVAIYEADALSFFQARIREKKRTLRLVVPPERQQYLLYSAGEALSFFNINSRSDFEIAREVLNARGIHPG